MPDYFYDRVPTSLAELKTLGDRRMDEARLAIAKAHCLADETREILAETERLHDRLHGVPLRARIHDPKG